MNILKMLKIFSFLAGLSLFGCTSYHQQNIIDIEHIWKADTCGINGNRAKLASLIASSPESLIGMSPNHVTNIFGEPDFIYEMNTHGGVLVYGYSTSSLEILKSGKCSDPVISSFALLFDKSSMKVKHVKEFIH